MGAWVMDACFITMQFSCYCVALNYISRIIWKMVNDKLSWQFDFICKSINKMTIGWLRVDPGNNKQPIYPNDQKPPINNYFVSISTCTEWWFVLGWVGNTWRAITKCYNPQCKHMKFTPLNSFQIHNKHPMLLTAYLD